jgi:hypothetical protein
MSRITFDHDLDLARAGLEQTRHREDFVRALVSRLETTPRLGAEGDRHYDDWYVQVLEDGLFRRVFVVEYQEWRHHVEDLLRDQLSRNQIDYQWWEEARETAGEERFVNDLRRILSEQLDVELPEAVWQGLLELALVAETIGQGTREARASLSERLPQYFDELDVFGDGDDVARLTLRQAHAERAFAVGKAFWEALPYQLLEESA